MIPADRLVEQGVRMHERGLKMSFSQTLRRTVEPLTEAVEHRDDADAQAATILTHFAPHLLRRLAEVAAVFDRPGLHSG